MATVLNSTRKLLNANETASGTKESVLSTEEDVRCNTSVISSIPETANGANAGTYAEKSMGILEGVRLYPKAIGWSIFISTAVIMEGFDVVLLASFYAFPPFQQKYGVKQSDGTYQLTAAWQAGLSNGANVGEILGLFITGIIAEKYGYRKTMIGALFLVSCFIFIPFFAQNVETLLVAEILCGIPWGVFQTLTTAYASEVMPVPLRCYLTTYVNLCWVFGQFIASGVLRGFLSRTDQWAYRIPFAVQWIWPIPIMIGCIFAPESPWWCVRRGNIKAAKQNLLRLTSGSRDSNFSVDDTVAMMVCTDAHEKELSAGTSYRDCFKGTDLRRTEITCVVWAIQNLCGNAFMSYSTYFYKQAGLDTAHSFDLSLAQYALGIVGTVGSWFVMARVGRRKLYLYGLCALCVLLIAIGCMGTAKPSPILAWAIGTMLLVYTFVYDFTIGPVCYSLVAEISSVRLRQKTIVLGRNLYNFWGIINNIWTPYMLNPSAWNWGAKTGFFWLVWCAACAVWVYFRLPEPKGRTFGELDSLFEHRIDARRFEGVDVGVFGRREHSEVAVSKRSEAGIGVLVEECETKAIS